MANYDPVPSDAAQYGKASFWDGRYCNNPEPFDWYHPYEAIAGIVNKYADPSMRVMQVGCGNSTLTEEMYEDGYKNIWNIDLSRVVIDQMKEKTADFARTDISFKPSKDGNSQAPLKADEVTGIQWHQGDAIDMVSYLQDKVFDIVIDKATLDCVFCSDVPQRNVNKYLQEIERVLGPEGLYLCFSFGLPETRLSFLDNDEVEDPGFLAWTVDVHAIPKPTIDPFDVADLKSPEDVYYVYVCQKNPKLDNEKDLKKKHEELAKKGKKLKKKNRK